jgi:hypothetical protein
MNMSATGMHWSAKAASLEDGSASPSRAVVPMSPAIDLLAVSVAATRALVNQSWFGKWASQCHHSHRRRPPTADRRPLAHN